MTKRGGTDAVYDCFDYCGLRLYHGDGGARAVASDEAVVDFSPQAFAGVRVPAGELVFYFL